MKNIFKATFAVAAVAAVGMSSYYTQNAYNFGSNGENEIIKENIMAFSQYNPDAHRTESGNPNSACPIWNVSVRYSVPLWVSCTTGGSQKCKNETCPHGM